MAYIDKFTKSKLVWVNVYTEAVTKGYDLSYDYGKLVLDSLKIAPQRQILRKINQDKKVGTKLYLGRPCFLFGWCIMQSVRPTTSCFPSK